MNYPVIPAATSLQSNSDGLWVDSALEFTSAQASLISQSWSITELGNGYYGLPSYSSSIPAGGTFSFGYLINSASPATFQTSQLSCY